MFACNVYWEYNVWFACENAFKIHQRQDWLSAFVVYHNVVTVPVILYLLNHFCWDLSCFSFL